MYLGHCHPLIVSTCNTGGGIIFGKNYSGKNYGRNLVRDFSPHFKASSVIFPFVFKERSISSTHTFILYLAPWYLTMHITVAWLFVAWLQLYVTCVWCHTSDESNAHMSCCAVAREASINLGFYAILFATTTTCACPYLPFWIPSNILGLPSVISPPPF